MWRLPVETRGRALCDDVAEEREREREGHPHPGGEEREGLLSSREGHPHPAGPLRHAHGSDVELSSYRGDS